MRRSTAHTLVGALIAATSLFTAQSAFASFVCHTKGGVDVVVQDVGQCEFKVSGGCTAQCTPINFTAQCNAQCSGKCTASADVSCSGTCGGSCMAKCTTNPGSFDCEGSCNTDCTASCSSKCSGKDSSCAGTCKANCNTDCHGQCTAVPPSADCAAKCMGCCSGSCTAQANLDCDVSCSGSCTANLMGGCNANCSAPNGALFCDGQFIDVTDPASCEVMISLNVTAAAKASCAAAPTTSAPVDGLAIAGLVAGLGAVIARRRRKS